VQSYNWRQSRPVRLPHVGIRICRMLLLIACAAASNIAAAASPAPYPSKPVRLIVPYPPGGGTDSVARAVSQKLSELWGQQFIVDNRGGAGGLIGTQTVAHAAPDGYTLLLATSSGLVVNPLLMPKLGYDAVKDFAPVSMLAINPTLLAAHTSVPVITIKELIAHAKANPGKLNYASVGQGTPIHLGMELFKMLTATDIVHVPYTGSGPAVTELVVGRVQLMLNSIPPLLPHVKSGRLKALGVGSTQRSAAIPNVPTIAEAGVPGFETVTWFGISAPAATLPSIIGRLNEGIVKVLADPDLLQRLASQGSEARATTPAVMATYMREESARWKKVIATAHISIE
jgi:tripartite-type tricarboxylate transporter receptor subunit TctC